MIDMRGYGEVILAEYRNKQLLLLYMKINSLGGGISNLMSKGLSAAAGGNFIEYSFN